MPVARLDYVTICTRDVARTVTFWRDIVGFEPGPRPDFSFDGAWLYCQGRPVVHLVERDAAPGGVIDHAAFWATDLAGTIARLEERGVPYDLKPLPPGVPQSGTWQLFIRDPNGARIELDFNKDETL